ncbi:MAG: hypothetical protein GY785_20160, partial [Gammaproteobacteria bacterium]|nr:hypothetical protein [Gammaproteobacteria bacterium]
VLSGPSELIPIRWVNHYGITNVNNPPGAIPDPNRQFISQWRSIGRIAQASGEFLFEALDDGDMITVRDDFNTSSFNNNDGTLNWAGPWLEVDGAGAGPTSGNVLITGGELSLDDRPNTGGEPSLEREANLFDFTSATLSFGFRTTSGVEAGDPDSVVIEVSGNGGTTWTVLETFDSFDGINSGSRSYDISAFIATNTRIRFRVNNLYGGPNEKFLVDYVEIALEGEGGGI